MDLDLALRYSLPCSSRDNSLSVDNFLGLPLTPPSIYSRSWMAGGLVPVMYWAIRPTLCSALRSDAEQLPHQAVMQPFRMLSMVQLENFLRIWGPMPNIFSLLTGKRYCHALFTTVLVCLDHDSSLVMWTPRNLKLSTRSTTDPSM